MSSFLQNLIHRHTQNNDVVMPRLAGVFEPGSLRPTSEIPVEEQSAMPNAGDNKTVSEKLPGNLPLKGEDDSQKRYSNIQQPSVLSNENLQNKKSSSAGITNIEKVNTIENIEKIITQQQIRVEHTIIDRKEDKTQDKPGVNDEIKKVLARLEAMEVLQNKPNREMQNPGVGFTMPHFQKEIVRPSIEKSMTNNSGQPSQPVIKIHIGKIEIKAEKQENIRVIRPPAPKPGLSLDQYLQDRKSKS